MFETAMTKSFEKRLLESPIAWMKFMQLSRYLLSARVLTKESRKDKYLRKISFRVRRNWTNETFVLVPLLIDSCCLIKINFSC